MTYTKRANLHGIDTKAHAQSYAGERWAVTGDGWWTDGRAAFAERIVEKPPKPEIRHEALANTESAKEDLRRRYSSAKVSDLKALKAPRKRVGVLLDGACKPEIVGGRIGPLMQFEVLDSDGEDIRVSIQERYGKRLRQAAHAIYATTDGTALIGTDDLGTPVVIVMAVRT